jgi:seryl-tRNA synthetase
VGRSYQHLQLHRLSESSFEHPILPLGADGKKEKGYAHLLNGTAVAVSRAIIALLENFQQEDGSVIIPEKLRRYTGFDRISPA